MVQNKALVFKKIPQGKFRKSRNAVCRLASRIESATTPLCWNVSDILPRTGLPRLNEHLVFENRSVDLSQKLVVSSILAKVGRLTGLFTS